MLKNYLVVHIRQSDGIEFIHFHEFGKIIGTQHHGAGYANLGIAKILQTFVGFDHGIEKCQSAPFASHGTFTDTGKIGILVKPVTLKNGHNTAVFYSPVRNYCIKNNLTHFIHIRLFLHVHMDIFKKLPEGKHGP